MQENEALEIQDEIIDDSTIQQDECKIERKESIYTQYRKEKADPVNVRTDNLSNISCQVENSQDSLEIVETRIILEENNDTVVETGNNEDSSAKDNIETDNVNNQDDGEHVQGVNDAAFENRNYSESSGSPRSNHEMPLADILLELDMELDNFSLFTRTSTNPSDTDSNDVPTDEVLALKKIVIVEEGFQLASTETFIADENEGYELETMTCLICYESFASSEIIFCSHCDLHVCFPCLTTHVSSKIIEGVVGITCPGESCSRALSDQLVAAFAPDRVAIYFKNKVELENNPNRKTCPNCHKIEEMIDLKDKEKRKIRCSQCNLAWCFHCHAPWHSGITCENYNQDTQGHGKKALKFWAKNKGSQARNATKCPSCHFYIERISGCDHMRCNRYVDPFIDFPLNCMARY